MEAKEMWFKAQSWERELAEAMCKDNLLLLVERFFGQRAGKEPDRRLIQQYAAARYRMLVEAVGIIRESMADREGKPLITPPQWVDKTRGMDEDGLKAFKAAATVSVHDRRRDYSYDVPVSLEDNFAKLFEAGIRHGSVLSGRVVDMPNERDSQGFPIMLSALGRPLAMLTFDTRHIPGSLSTVSRSQMQNITLGAREAGWQVEYWGGKGLTVLLPLTKSGLSFQQVSEIVRDRLFDRDPGWRDRPDWLASFRSEYRNVVRQQGGRIMYTDRDIADAWNRLTEAIVRNVHIRQERENPRISDIQVGRKVNREDMTVEHTVRCRIDDDMQMSRTLHPLDGGRYDTAVHVGDLQQLNELKRELAATYFSEELRADRNQNQGLKR